ncbi:MAG: O-antigen ligase family protein [Aquificae bacterium]|nr:O-antigen ligase family protein [Aquificota bacterium]
MANRLLWLTFYLIYPLQQLPLKPYYPALTAASLASLFSLKRGLLRLLSFYWPFVPFLTWAWLSVLWSVDPEASVKMSLKLTVYAFGALGLGAFYLRDGDAFGVVAKGVFWSALWVSTAYLFLAVKLGLLQLFTGGFSMETVGEIARLNVGFGGGRNIMASWLAFALTFALPYLYARTRSLLPVLLSLPVLTALLLTLSRTALLSLLLAPFLGALLAPPKARRAFTRALLALLAAAALLLALNPFNLGSFVALRFLSALKALRGEAEDWGTEGRLELWHYALKAFTEEPLTGTGLGTLYAGLPSIGGVNNYHNVPLQLLAQTGLVGLTLFLLWSLFLFLTAFRLKRAYPLEGSVLLVNLLTYYFKSLLMFQYVDAEVWTLVGLTGGLYARYNLSHARDAPANSPLRGPGGS